MPSILFLTSLRTPDGRGVIPHPEQYMDWVPDNLGARVWMYLRVESLEGMNLKFAKPYIIFYPVLSKDGQAFPVNKNVQEMKGTASRHEGAWRGNLIIAKYDISKGPTGPTPFPSMINASMADFPLIKNYLITHAPPMVPQQRR
ncbi:hypothetical protein HGRIS_009843 [Hohenbuehelia grisea]|uniref:Uncharacterized protein n=1 Tax=Hohenbuehelia grisea TaxID=104357 RepID=A0ABR3J2T2_9AGAR